MVSRPRHLWFTSYHGGVTEPGHVTLLLRRLSGGDEQAGDELAPILYAELHRLAQRAMAATPSSHTLQPTALLNEAWIRLIDTEAPEWDGRTHFLGVAAKAMRSVLVDHARKRGTLKRGEAREKIDIDEAVITFEERAIDLLALDEALAELGKVDEELARIVELRFFGGMKHPEIAEVLETSLRSVERGWVSARAWLYQRVSQGDTHI